MNLKKADRPEALQTYHGTNIHRAVKKGSVTIVVDTKNYVRYVWKREGSTWLISSITELKSDR